MVCIGVHEAGDFIPFLKMYHEELECLEAVAKFAGVKPCVTRQLDLMAPLFGVKGWKHSY